MLQSKSFWIVQNIVVAAFWLAVLGMIATGHSHHRLVLIAAIVLAAHVIEVPIALRALRGSTRATVRICVMTLVFGYTWWMPARRGIFAG